MMGVLFIRKSPLTGKTNSMMLDVTDEQVLAWETGTLIQNAMPNLTADEREFIITGLMPGEFEQMFPPEGNDERASPTTKGNVKCMDCRCGGYGCPGMPPGYEENLMKDWR